MNKKILATIVGVLVVAVGYMYFSSGTEQINHSSTTNISVETTSTPIPSATSTPTFVSTPTPKITPVIEGPADWVTFWNEEWGIGFKYPSEWNFEKRYHPGLSSKLYGFKLEGGGYEIRIGRAGTGLPEKEWVYSEYVIEDNMAKVWQTDLGDRYQLVVVITNNNDNSILHAIQFWVWTPDKNKELLDKFLSTVKFY